MAHSCAKISSRQFYGMKNLQAQGGVFVFSGGCVCEYLLLIFKVSSCVLLCVLVMISVTNGRLSLQKLKLVTATFLARMLP